MGHIRTYETQSFHQDAHPESNISLYNRADRVLLAVIGECHS